MSPGRSNAEPGIAMCDPNVRAHNRTSHLPRNREMVQKWADFWSDHLRDGAEIVPLRAA
jgi:hypothetical protein